MFAAVMAVACGGALGSAARFLTVVIAQSLFGARFPIGTLVVNSVGSFLIGLFMGLFMDRLADVEYLRLFLVVGILGGYTTFFGGGNKDFIIVLLDSQGNLVHDSPTHGGWYDDICYSVNYTFDGSYIFVVLHIC